MLCQEAPLDADTRMRDVLTEHGPSVTRYVLGLTLGNRQTTEDVVQETMVRAWRHLDTLPAEREAARRWLFTVARRLVIDEARRRQARPAEVAQVDPDSVRTGDETAPAALANLVLREAAGCLSAAHRKVLYEVYYEDRSVPEVAMLLGVPVGTVRSRIHYALRCLRRAITD